MFSIVRRERMNAAQRRYLVRFFPAMTAYCVVLFACNWAIDAYAPRGAALFVLSLLPSLPVLAVIATMGLYLVEERDEFIRNRLVTAMMWGLGVLLAVTTVWGFLENGGAVPHFPTFMTFPLWCGSFGLAQCAMTLRDRRIGRGDA